MQKVLDTYLIQKTNAVDYESLFEFQDDNLS